MRSLIVEDEFTSRMQIKYFLEEYGCCDIVVNGVEAVEAYKMAIAAKKPYDLICLDLQLPRKDGFQVLLDIRNIEVEMAKFLEKPALIFVMTAVANPEGVFRTKGLCNEYLIKPVDKAVLDERLRKHSLTS